MHALFCCSTHMKPFLLRKLLACPCTNACTYSHLLKSPRLIPMRLNTLDPILQILDDIEKDVHEEPYHCELGRNSESSSSSITSSSALSPSNSLIVGEYSRILRPRPLPTW